MKESFLQNDDTFVFLNRGLVMSVGQAVFDNVKGVVQLTLEDPDLHGLLDGGHTYQIIRNNLPDLGTTDKQYVKIEVIEGFGAEELVKLVDARNSSNQVRDESLMNLANDFNRIKSSLKGEPFADKIAYKEYETFENGDPKPISIREIISYLMTMDRKNFNRTVHPINAYRSKAACLKHFRDNKESFGLFIRSQGNLKLWDTIHQELPDMYNRMRGERGGVSGGKFGKLTGVIHHEGSVREPLDFLGGNSRYTIPAGLKYPILGAFRALLVEKRDRYVWADNLDPVELFKGELGTDLVQTIGEFALRRKNPSKTGKSPLVWQSCYQCAELATRQRPPSSLTRGVIALPDLPLGLLAGLNSHNRRDKVSFMVYVKDHSRTKVIDAENDFPSERLIRRRDAVGIYW